MEDIFKNCTYEYYFLNYKDPNRINVKDLEALLLQFEYNRKNHFDYKHYKITLDKNIKEQLIKEYNEWQKNLNQPTLSLSQRLISRLLLKN